MPAGKAREAQRNSGKQPHLPHSSGDYARDWPAIACYPAAEGSLDRSAFGPGTLRRAARYPSPKTCGEQTGPAGVFLTGNNGRYRGQSNKRGRTEGQATGVRSVKLHKPCADHAPDAGLKAESSRTGQEYSYEPMKRNTKLRTQKNRRTDFAQ